jgi:potassium-transporting ATPase KdpC subunit
MRSLLRAALSLLAALTLITGILYPLAVSGLAGVLFPGRARGSLLEWRGRIVGSELIGQSFTDPRYFWGRPSATSPPYNAALSSGSNLGPANPALADSIRARLVRLGGGGSGVADTAVAWPTGDPGVPGGTPGRSSLAPVDLVTASGSGLDPDISPAAAWFQVPRVARRRGIDGSAVRALVTRNITGRQFGLLGEPRVNVLRLNLALDDLSEAAGRAGHGPSPGSKPAPPPRR